MPIIRSDVKYLNITDAGLDYYLANVRLLSWLNIFNPVSTPSKAILSHKIHFSFSIKSNKNYFNGNIQTLYEKLFIPVKVNLYIYINFIKKENGWEITK